LPSVTTYTARDTDVSSSHGTAVEGVEDFEMTRVLTRGDPDKTILTRTDPGMGPPRAVRSHV